MQSLDVTKPGALSEPPVSDMVNVFLQPYWNVYVTSTPLSVFFPVMPHWPWEHGPTEPICIRAIATRHLICRAVQKACAGRWWLGGRWQRVLKARIEGASRRPWVCVCVCVSGRVSGRGVRAGASVEWTNRVRPLLQMCNRPAACTASQQLPSHLSLTSLQSAGLDHLYLTTAGASAYCWQPDGKSMLAMVSQNDIL
eukprot:COSAG01_NODE_1174_length_11380_cov_2.922205_2_plen_197_part_00